MKKPSKQKLNAYKRHWVRVRRIQDEFSRQYIHEGLNFTEVTDKSQISRSTVLRFFHFGRSTKYKGYSLFHGPAITTILGIASALDLELKLVKKNGKGNGKA